MFMEKLKTMSANTNSKEMKSHGQEVTLDMMIEELKEYTEECMDEHTEFVESLLDLYNKKDYGMSDALENYLEDEIRYLYKWFKLNFRWQKSKYTKEYEVKELIYVG